MFYKNPYFFPWTVDEHKCLTHNWHKIKNSQQFFNSKNIEKLNEALKHINVAITDYFTIKPDNMTM